MAKKKITTLIKLQCPAERQHLHRPLVLRLALMPAFPSLQQFNDRTKSMEPIDHSVVISVYSDKTFTFILKTPLAAVLIKKACVEKEPQLGYRQGRAFQGKARGNRKSQDARYQCHILKPQKDCCRYRSQHGEVER